MHFAIPSTEFFSMHFLYKKENLNDRERGICRICQLQLQYQFSWNCGGGGGEAHEVQCFLVLFVCFFICCESFAITLLMDTWLLLLLGALLS